LISSDLGGERGGGGGRGRGGEAIVRKGGKKEKTTFGLLGLVYP